MKKSLLFSFFLFTLHALSVYSSDSCATIFNHDQTAVGQGWSELEKENLKNFHYNLNSPSNKTVFYNDKSYSRDHVRILRSILGIPNLKQSFLPTLKQIVMGYEAKMDQYVRAGLIKQENVLHPAFIFKSGDQIIWLRYGESIPPSAVPYEGLVPSHQYFKMLADGFFPLGGKHAATSNYGYNRSSYISEFEHDLAHLTGFIQNPNYMQLLRNVSAAKYLALNNLPDAASKKNDDIPDASYYFSEGMIVLRRGNSSSLLKKLILPKASENRSVPTLTEIENHLKQITREDLETLASHLSKNYVTYFEAFGGGARELENSDNPIHDPIRALLKELTFYTEPGARKWIKVKNVSALPLEKLIKTMAKVELAIVWLKEISLDEWAQAAVYKDLDKNSKIHQLMCESGIWPEQGLRQIFCK